MADLVVKDLADLADDLSSLIDAFDGALKFQDQDKGLWGQHNANLSMGDFADNWTLHRKKMIEAMKSLRDKVQQIDEDWAQADLKLLETFK